MGRLTKKANSIISKAKEAARSRRELMRLRKGYRLYFRAHHNAAFLVFTPEHGNLGDHAIASAEAKLLNECGIEYIEITGQQLAKLKRRDLLKSMNGYPIIVNGGGNLGTLWVDVESIFREIIKKNPRSKIMLMPNTICYEDSEWGKQDFELSKSIYNAHDELYLYARERASYEIMRAAYKNVKLVPDVVLFLKPNCLVEKRDGCLICLRSDLEKTLSDEQQGIINAQVSELFGERVTSTDMIVDGDHVPIHEREAALQKKYDQFASSELVITDRLHAMLFAAITNTPCLVVNSKSPKVRGCYEWIKTLDYIRFVDDVSDIASEYRSIPSAEHRYDNSHLIRYYDELKDDLRKIILEK